MATIIEIILLSVGGIIFPLVVLAIYDITQMGKAVILYFESEKSVKILKQQVVDGTIRVKNKVFYVDKSTPPLTPSGTIIRAHKPLYAIKWDKPLPLTFDKPKDKNGKEFAITPENLNNLIENKTLGQLLTPKDDNKTIIIYVAMGAIMGGLLGYVIAGL